MSSPVSIRNALLGVYRAAIAGGQLVTAQGAKPSPIRVPTLAETLSRHAIPASLPQPADGVLTVPSVMPDTAAHGGGRAAGESAGLPTWWVLVAADGSLVLCKSQAEAPITLALPGGATQIVAGREVRVLELQLTDGNA